MGRWSGFLVFFAVALILLGAIHYYLWLRLVRDPQLPAPWRTLATATISSIGLAIPIALVFFRRPATPAGKLLVWIAFVWLGLMFLLLVAVLATDVLRIVFWAFRRVANASAAPDDERRLFLARSIAGGVLATATGVGAWGVRAAVGPVSVRRVEVTLDRLSAQHDGLMIAQLTDLHIGPTIGRNNLAAIVNTTNALAPDIVAITGDLVDGSVAELREAVAPLADLRARYGVFFVTGNHEYFSGARQWVDEISRLGIRVLRNERVEIHRNGAVLDLAGVDDLSAARFGDGHGEDISKALADRDPLRPVILLAHQPRSALRSAEYGVDLQLSGHTHGGQIWPFGALVSLQQVFLAGLHRRKNTQVYVSRGTGYWGPPMRVGAPSEIAQIVLRTSRGSDPSRPGPA
jgi:predicted MPP superfamily phosphohydrolase